MKYMGSKRRIAKHILPIILQGRTTDQYYVEPFCGGCNTIDKVDGNRIASDINPYLIAMWQAVANGWLPKSDYTEDYYQFVKNNRDIDPVLTGYIGFALSFGGKFFGGWRRDRKNRDYVLEAYNSAIKQFPKLVDVSFHCCSYQDLEIPNNSIVYCDIPYKSTTKYNTGVFEHNKFYDWCFNMKSLGHTIYISEYSMPQEFKCVYEMSVENGLNGKFMTERLFTL